MPISPDVYAVGFDSPYVSLALQGVGAGQTARLWCCLPVINLGRRHYKLSRNADAASTVIAFAIDIFFHLFSFYRISLQGCTARVALQVKRNQNTVPPLALPLCHPKAFALAAERRASLNPDPRCSITAWMP